jgi:hypothetical protein
LTAEVTWLRLARCTIWTATLFVGQMADRVCHGLPERPHFVKGSVADFFFCLITILSSSFVFYLSLALSISLSSLNCLLGTWMLGNGAIVLAALLCELFRERCLSGNDQLRCAPCR